MTEVWVVSGFEDTLAVSATRKGAEALGERLSARWQNEGHYGRWLIGASLECRWEEDPSGEIVLATYRTTSASRSPEWARTSISIQRFVLEEL